MQMLARMNAKMDQGYKLTNFYCTFCNGVTMAKPMGENAEGVVYCPKCQKEYVPVREDGEQGEEEGEGEEGIVEIGGKKEINQSATKSAQKFQPLNADPEPQPEDPTEQQYNEFLALYNSPKKTAQQLKSQEISKKMGTKLISGWAMMEEACLDCNVPLMRSKKGNLVCCGCEKDYMKSKEEKGKKEEKKEEKKEVKEQSKETAQPQKQQKPKQQPQSQPQHESQTQSQPLRHIKLHPHTQSPSPSPSPSPNPNPNPNPEPSLHHKHHSHTNMQHNTQLCQKIERISYGTLDFLQGRMQRAFEMNDLQAVERVLRLVKMVKELM